MSTIKWSPVVAAAMNQAPGTVIIGMPGSGKALWNEEVVYTPTGIKKVKDVKVGDKLLGKDGQAVTVLGVYPQGKKRLYKVTLLDGRSIICSKDHLFTVGRRSHGQVKYLVTSVADLMKAGLKATDGSCRFFLQNNDCLKFPPRKLKMSPYVFGVFIGNGCKSNGSLILSAPDEQVPMKVAQILSKDLKRDVVAIKNSENNYTWNFFYKDSFCLPKRQPVKAKDLDSSLVTLLTNTYSKDRFLPEKYKYCSEEQRMELIRGLLDTDGSISLEKGVVSYCSSSRQLIKDIIEVLRGLGGFHVTETKPDVRRPHTSYTIYISCRHDRKPSMFTLKSKLERAVRSCTKADRIQYDRVRIASIEKLEKKDKCTCFLVDAPDHQFIAGDVVVTHNTFFMINVAANALGMGQRVIALDPKDDFAKLYNVNPHIHIVDINNIQPGALNPFEFLKTYDDDGTERKVDTNTIMTIIELLCGKLDKETLIAINPIIQDFVNTRSLREYVDMQDVADYLFQVDNEAAQHIGTILTSFEGSQYSQLLFTREQNVEPLSLRPRESIVISLDGMKLPGYEKDPEDYNPEEKLSSAIIFIIAKKLMQILTKFDKVPTLFFCDEAHILFNNREMSDVIERFLSLGRSKNTAIILASQGITKFPKNISQYVTSKFMFKSGRVEAEAFLDMFDNAELDPAKAIDRTAIVYAASEFKSGTCFFIDRLNRNGIFMVKSVYDHSLLTSNPFKKS